MRIPGIPEEVELVTSFDELRAGMIVWIVSCSACGSHHRKFLLRLEKSNFGEKLVGWLGDPIVSPCMKARGHTKTFLTPKCLAFVERRVYRVVDRAIDAQTTERKREMVRP
jgi:hypothetical protein